MTARRINQAQLARLCGASRTAIGKLVAKGVIRLDDDGLVDQDSAIAAIAANADPSHAASRNTIAARIATGKLAAPGGNATQPVQEAPQPPPAAAGVEITSFQVARTLREKYAALNERQEYEERRGELIPRAVVERLVFGLAREAQESLRAIADRIAPLVAAETDAHRCHGIIDAEIRQVIAQIGAARPVPPPPAAAANAA